MTVLAHCGKFGKYFFKEKKKITQNLTPSNKHLDLCLLDIFTTIELML